VCVDSDPFAQARFAELLTAPSAGRSSPQPDRLSPRAVADSDRPLFLSRRNVAFNVSASHLLVVKI
jgi:hypothetical protein